MRKTMICPVCGKSFVQRNCRQISCSRACGRRREAARHRAQKHEAVCRNCGKVFMTADKAVYCSAECRITAARAPMRDKDREHTVDTAYLCQKWYREGMDTREIAEILRRSVESVNLALAVRLGPEDYAMMEEYAR